MTAIDMTGKRFGHLTVLRRVPHETQHGAYWLCRCDCGREIEVRGWYLRNRTPVSCGCQNGVKHGYCRGVRPKRLYVIWRDMRSRCNNPKNIGFHLYGGRGIKVCEEWKDFSVFAAWAEANGYADDLSIDRIDSDGNYCPENCRWATNHDQQRNKRRTVFITVGDETKCMADWARTIGVYPATIRKKLKAGKDVAQFIEEKLKENKAS